MYVAYQSQFEVGDVEWKADEREKENDRGEKLVLYIYIRAESTECENNNNNTGIIIIIINHMPNSYTSKHRKYLKFQ